MNKRLYVDFHILQTVPPSCINRDDTGSPKTAVYGGVLRARVSSQAWKHAMRAAFAENAQLDVGKRTKKAAELEMCIRDSRYTVPDPQRSIFDDGIARGCSHCPHKRPC